MPKPWETYQSQPSQPAGPWNQFQSPGKESSAGPWSSYGGPGGTPEHTEGEKAQATLEGFGNAATAGNLARLQAAAEPYTDKLFDAVTGGNVSKDAKYDYVKARDQNVNRQEAQARDMPGYYYGGEAAGTLAALEAPGAIAGRAGLLASGAKYDPFLKKAIEIAPSRLQQALSVAKTGAGGAALGLAANPGDVEGQESGLQLGERLQNAKRGLALGLAGGAAAQGLNAGFKALERAPEIAPRMAEAVAAHPKVANVIRLAKPENLGILSGLLHGESVEQRLKNAGMGYVAGKMIPLGGSAAAYAGKGLGRVGAGLLKPLVKNPAGLGLAIESVDQGVSQ